MSAYAAQSSPESKLWSAVLVNAITDLESTQYRPAAERWFGSDRRGVGSFLWVCAQLDIDSEKFKVPRLDDGLKRLRAEAAARKKAKAKAKLATREPPHDDDAAEAILSVAKRAVAKKPAR